MPPLPAATYLWLADVVLLAHLAVVLFVVGGLAAIVAGNTLARWPAVNRWPFRAAHLAAIGVVVAQAWAGMVCPLTTLEMWLRARGGGATYAGGFVAHWVQAALYHDLPAWVFTAAYSAFGAAVAAAWIRWPPAGRGSRTPSPAVPR